MASWLTTSVLWKIDCERPVASGAVIYNGTVVVGSGIGQRGSDPNDPSTKVWQSPSVVTAFCVPGTPGC